MLTDQQRQAVALIGSGESMGATASAVGCRLATLWDWYYEVEFAAALRQSNEARQQYAFARQVSLLEEAISVVHECMRDENSSVRLRAAKIVLDAGLAEREDTEEELRHVQAAFARDLLRRLASVPENELAQTVRLLRSRAESEP